jgi:hypothetical protein
MRPGHLFEPARDIPRGLVPSSHPRLRGPAFLGCAEPPPVAEVADSYWLP